MADKHDLPKKLSSGRAHLHQAACQSLSLHHGWWWGKLVPLDQAAGDASRGCTLAWWDDDAHPIVAAASHGATASVHHEAHKEPVQCNMAQWWKGEQTNRLRPSVITSEDCYHAVIKKSHNQTPERKEANEKKDWKGVPWELSPGSLFMEAIGILRQISLQISRTIFIIEYWLKFFANCQGRSLNK